MCLAKSCNKLQGVRKGILGLGDEVKVMRVKCHRAPSHKGGVKLHKKIRNFLPGALCLVR